MQFDDLRGQVALVTGASRRQGIGAAICRTLAAQGVDIFFTTWQPYDRQQDYDSDEDGPEALQTELRAMGVRAEYIEIDLADPRAPAQVIAAVGAQFGQPHILVNNAVHDIGQSYETLTAASLDQHYAVNLRAVALLSAHFARGFKTGIGGRIINLTSGQGLHGMPGQIGYAATKGAVEALTRTLADEVAHLGITVNAVDPGATDSGWMTDAIRAELLPRMRMGRLGQPEDVVRLIVFLASDAGQWITGQIMRSRGA